jgi:hypothetical protein
MISVEEMQQMVGSQDKPRLETGEELRFNENICYADFDLAVEAVAKKASMLGVRREKIVTEKFVGTLKLLEPICQLSSNRQGF